MGKYIVRRLLQMIPVIIGVTFIIYVMVYGLPGIRRSVAAVSGPARRPTSRSSGPSYNLDKPLVVQYVLYLGNLLQGDLGTNFYRHRWSRTSWRSGGPPRSSSA